MTEGLRVQCEEWVFDGKGWVPKSGKGNRQIRSCRDLDVFDLSYTLAMEIFRLSARFPPDFLKMSDTHLLIRFGGHLGRSAAILQKDLPSADMKPSSRTA
jgi:hypothetical protein